MDIYYDRINAEIDAIIAECVRKENYRRKFEGDGWLKPHKQLKPFSNNPKINYNLPRSRLREKKQIFLKAA